MTTSDGSFNTVERKPPGTVKIYSYLDIYFVFRTMCIRVRIAEARRFIVDCLKAAGANETAAMQQAELFVQADRTGHQSHGLNRLGE